MIRLHYFQLFSQIELSVGILHAPGLLEMSQSVSVVIGKRNCLKIILGNSV